MIEREKLIAFVIGLVVMVILIVGLIQGLIPTVIKLYPAYNETLSKFQPEKVSAKLITPNDNAKVAFNEIRTAIEAAANSANTNCFVAYKIDTFRKDLGTANIGFVNFKTGMSMDIKDADPKLFRKPIDNIKADCLIKGIDLVRHIGTADYKKPIPYIEDIKTDSILTGAEDGSVTLNSNIISKKTSERGSSDPYSIDGVIYLYKPKEAGRVCFITGDNLQDGFVKDCAKYNPSLGLTTAEDICADRLKNVKVC